MLLVFGYTIVLVYHGAYRMLGVPECQRGIFAAATLAIMLVVSVGTGILSVLLAPMTTPWSLSIN
jgi:hypothetical protein